MTPVAVFPGLVPAKGLIVCADDFAASSGVSRGIAQLAQCGRISATSVMVLSPRWAHDVALLRGMRGQTDVGLHLDWTSDFALVAGHGMTLTQAMRRAVLGGFDQAQARAQIEHQLDLFEAHWGSAPDYVDGHQHVQQFNGIRQALLAVLTRRYAVLPRKPYLRVSRVAQGGLDLKSAMINAMGANALEIIASDAGTVCARGLFGVYDFKGDGARYGRLMQRWLRRAPSGSILMCHPAQAVEAGDPIGVARVQEFGYLNGPDFATALQTARVRPARGCEVLGHELSAVAP
ncbi:MAG: ChbG/HpnK family deacetylase [Rhodoferax sp.]|nr:ChbG/HpnK family deacetylase [Rhodoferax sp.]